MDKPLIAKTPCLFTVAELVRCACEMRLINLLHSPLAQTRCGVSIERHKVNQIRDESKESRE